MFAKKSNALPEFCRPFFVLVFVTLGPYSLRFLRLPRFTALIVVSELVIDLFEDTFKKFHRIILVFCTLIS